MEAAGKGTELAVPRLGLSRCISLMCLLGSGVKEVSRRPATAPSVWSSTAKACCHATVKVVCDEFAGDSV